MRRTREPTSDRATIERLFELLAMRNAQGMDFESMHSALEAADAFFGAGAPDPKGEVEVNLGDCWAVLRIPETGEQGDQSANRVLVYFHGGGFCIGSPTAERGLTLRMAASLGVPVLVPDYRKAPTNPFPAAVHDAVAAVRWISGPKAREWIGPEPTLVLGGTSAGANLALEAALHLRDEHDPAFDRIAGIFCITGWFDLTNSSASQVELEGSDPILDPALTEAFAAAYLPEGKRDDPAASPLYADLTGLPPVRIDGASSDTLRDDSRRLADALDGAGVDYEFVEWESMPHMFPYFWAMLEEGAAYLDNELPSWFERVSAG